MVSCGGEIVGAFLRGEAAKGVGDGLPEVGDCTGGRGAQEGLEVGEGHFDGVEVGAVGRQVRRLAPAASIACLTPWTLWAGRLSMMTMSPGRNSETSACST